MSEKRCNKRKVYVYEKERKKEREGTYVKKERN